MPLRVPAYNSPEVLPTGPSPRLGNAVSGEPVAEAGRRIAQAGAQAQQLGQRITDQIDEARAREADVAVAGRLNAILHAPEQGFLNQRGKVAVEGFDAADRMVQEAIEDAAKGLHTPNQQAMFRRVADDRLLKARNLLGAHVAEQSARYNADQVVAQRQTYIDDAVARPFDNDLIAARIGLVAGSVDREARLYGWSPEVTEVKRREALTTMHGDVLDAMIARDRGSDARAYLAAHLDDIDPTARGKFEATVKQAGIVSDSQALADRLADEGGSLAEQQARVRKLAESGEISAELRDATNQRLEHAQALANQQRGEQRLALAGALQDFYIKNPGTPPSALPAGLYQAAKDNGLLDNAISLANMTGRGGSGDALASAAVYADLAAQKMADPEGFEESFDARAYIGRLSPKQLGALTKHVKDGSFADFSSGLDMIRGELAAAGIDTTPTIPTGRNVTAADTADAQARARDFAMFQQAYMGALTDARREKGRPLTAQQKRDLGLYMLAQQTLATRHTEPGMFTGEIRKVTTNSAPRYRMLATSSPEQIPEITRKGIIRGLRAELKRPPTPAEVVAEYRRRALGAPENAR